MFTQQEEDILRACYPLVRKINESILPAKCRGCLQAYRYYQPGTGRCKYCRPTGLRDGKYEELEEKSQYYIANYLENIGKPPKDHWVMPNPWVNSGFPYADSISAYFGERKKSTLVRVGLCQVFLDGIHARRYTRYHPKPRLIDGYFDKLTMIDKVIDQLKARGLDAVDTETDLDDEESETPTISAELLGHVDEE